MLSFIYRLTFFSSSFRAIPVMLIPRAVLKTFVKQSDGLHFLHLNTRSMLSCLYELKYSVINSGIDLICLSETWLGENTPDAFVDIQGYTIFRNDRYGRRGGGVAVYVSNRLNATVLEKSGRDSESEYLILRVSFQGCSIIVGCIYIPPKCNYTELSAIIRDLSCRHANIVFCGDFNINLLSDASEYFRDFIQSVGLHLVTNGNEPTCFSPTSNSLLDYFIVADMDRISFNNQLSCSFSDHDMIFLTYSIMRNDSPGPSQFQFRDFKHINYDALFHESSRLPWHDILATPDIDSKINLFNRNVQYLFDKFVPLRTANTSRKSCPWFNEEILRLIAIRDMTYFRWKHNKTVANYGTFKIARNAVTAAIRNARKIYIHTKLLSNTDSKVLWNKLRNLGIVNRKNNPLPDIDVNVLNASFTNANGGAVSSTSFSTFNTSGPDFLENRFYFRCVTDIDVHKAMLSIKSSAIGLDGVNTKFLKLIFPSILCYFTSIVNTILMASVYPSIWKFSKVIPIPKVKDPKSPSEFRPISILPFLSKVVERIMAQQIIEHLETNKLLCDLQSGFRKGHSTATALLKVSDDIRCNLDRNVATVLVLLDFSKAFDVVDHNILFEKLYCKFKFSLHATDLIRNYIANRVQCVSMNGFSSDYLPLSCGVPQGSILGPLLFALYINDLTDGVGSCNLHLYADDVQLYLSCSCDRLYEKIHEMNSILSNVHRWALNNKLKLNAPKSQAIVIYKRSLDTSNLPPILLDNTIIPFSDKVKNLGVIFNKRLTWDDHLSITTSKIYGILRQLWVTCKDLSAILRRKLVLALVMPLFNYCDCVYATDDYLTSQRTRVTFNDCVRFMFNLRRHDHISHYVNELIGLSIDEHFKFRKCLLLFNLILSKTPGYLYDKIQFLHSARTNNLLLPRYYCLQSKRSFFVCASRLWNQLPSDCKTALTLHSFKQRYKMTL